MDSDHVPMQLNIDLKMLPTRPTRVTMFNFKNGQGRERFKQLTTDTTEFTECFISMQPLQDQCDKRHKQLCHIAKTCFLKLELEPKGLRGQQQTN